MKPENKQRLNFFLRNILTFNIIWLLYNCVRYYFDSDLSANGFSALSSYLLSVDVVIGQILYPILLSCLNIAIGSYSYAEKITQRVRRQRIKYVMGDFIASNIAWLLYNCFRYNFHTDISIIGFNTLSSYLLSDVVVAGQILFPIMIVCLYAISGYYNNVFYKSRVNVLFNTVTVSLISTLCIFFIALINDMISDQRSYNYELISFLWIILFLCVGLVRYVLVTKLSNDLRSGKVSFNTLIVGTSSHAVSIARQLMSLNRMMGYNVVGYVRTEASNVSKSISLPVYEMDELPVICENEQIAELILIPSSQDENDIISTINRLYLLDRTIKIAPDVYNILIGKMRLSNILGEPLIDISAGSMSACETNIKRILDVLVSALALLVLLPIFIVIAAIIKLDSKGSVIYSQERIGYRNKRFDIYKFRSMSEGAEKSGIPELSSLNDKRLTRVGRFLRKYRIDELPQFWNVLIGDMSLVGPRPERQYFIDKILEKAPFYALLHKVRPGITSMGMVKYGYATNIDEMIARCKYDLLYIENMSLINDIKILIYTIQTVFKGKGL